MFQPILCVWRTSISLNAAIPYPQQQYCTPTDQYTAPLLYFLRPLALFVVSRCPTEPQRADEHPDNRAAGNIDHPVVS